MWQVSTALRGASSGTYTQIGPVASQPGSRNNEVANFIEPTASDHPVERELSLTNRGHVGMLPRSFFAGLDGMVPVLFVARQRAVRGLTWYLLMVSRVSEDRKAWLSAGVIQS